MSLLQWLAPATNPHQAEALMPNSAPKAHPAAPHPDEDLCSHKDCLQRAEPRPTTTSLGTVSSWVSQMCCQPLSSLCQRQSSSQFRVQMVWVDFCKLQPGTSTIAVSSQVTVPGVEGQEWLHHRQDWGQAGCHTN